MIDHGVNAVSQENGLVKEGEYIAYSHMRAYFGTVVSLVIAIVGTFLTKNSSEEETTGLTICTIDDAKRAYKGAEPSEDGVGIKLSLKIEIADVKEARLSKADMEKLHAKPGDILFVSDPRAWLGGLRSIQVKAGEPHQSDSVIKLSQEQVEQGSLRSDKDNVIVEKIM